MGKCDCYRTTERICYTPFYTQAYFKTVGICNGTKEQDECSCGGDEAKCDFYPKIRAKAIQKQKEDNCLIVTYDFCPPDVPTLCIAKKDGDKVKVLNTIQGDAAFGMYEYLKGNAYLLNKQGKWKLNKDGSGTCDQCGRIQKDVWDYDNWQNYCGHCGAEMSV